VVGEDGSTGGGGVEGQEIGILHHHPDAAARGIGEGEGLQAARHQMRQMRGFAGGLGQAAQGRHRGLARRDGGFAQRGEAQDGRAKAVFARGAGLFQQAARFQFGQETVAGRLVQAGRAGEAG
jgi:hypothetical protein